LNVIETRLNELVEPRLVEGKSRCDEADVESGPPGSTNEIHNIGAGQRLASGEINLKYARFGCLAEPARPHLGRKFAGAMSQFKRI
jgi:hypothetical protein